jgi:lysophospholipase L1-like esterase
MPTPEEKFTYTLQYHHPEKILARLPGMSEETVAACYGVDIAVFRALKDEFAHNALHVAEELLREPGFADRVSRLPFAPGNKVVGLGDSLTDDYQGWLEILRHLVAIVRPDDGIALLNFGISGETTAQVVSRFIAVVREQPQWILCLVGTNDVRRHGATPTKTLISRDETFENFRLLRSYGVNQTSAHWLWMTPPGVIEEKIAAHWYLSSVQVMYRNADLLEVGRTIREMPDPVVDLQALFGVPGRENLLQEDGLHPSLEGQKSIARAVVEHLSP